MESQYKECGVVMIKVNEQIYQVEEGKIFINDSREHSWGKLQALKCERVTTHGHAWNGSGIQTYIKHLYITSDDEIEKGDWFIVNGVVHRCIGLHKVSGDIESDNRLCYDISKCVKIIATTDTSLKIPHKHKELPDWSLPQPSGKFIQAYIESYNQGNPIEKVLVEYEEKCVGCGDFPASGITHCTYPIPDKHQRTLNWFLKLKDNNIIIKKVKDSWTREEIYQILSSYRTHAWKNGAAQKELEKWIEENL